MEHTLSDLSSIFFANAVALLYKERRKAQQIDLAWRMLAKRNFSASLNDWMAGPEIAKCLGKLKKFKHYRVLQAVRLLQEAVGEMKKGGGQH